MRAKILALLCIVGLILCVGLTAYAAVMNTYTNETNLADDDEFLVWDTSEGTGTVNNITWSALKSEIAAESYALGLVAANEATDETCFPLFVTAATGSLGGKTNAGLSFNSATGVLAATGFSGPLTGNVTGNCSGTAASLSGSALPAASTVATSVAIGADPADAGAIRLSNAEYIYSEADAAGTDISVIGVDSSEIVQIGASGASGVTITPATTITGVLTTGSNIELGHASENTLSASSGVLSIEGVALTKITSTQVLNFGGATLEIPNSDDPDLTVTGQISYDTDGWLRVTADNGTTQKAIREMEDIHVTVYKPNDMDDAQRDHFWVWSNESGMSFIVTGWKGWSTSDDTTLTIYEEDADGANDATVDAVEIATGSGPYTGSDSTITGNTVENGHLIYLDFDDTDAPAMVKITIYGYFVADVN